MKLFNQFRHKKTPDGKPLPDAKFDPTDMFVGKKPPRVQGTYLVDSGRPRMTESVSIRPALLPDLCYVDSLQRKNADELAFYPKQVFEREMRKMRVVLAIVNGEPAGYLYHGSIRPQAQLKIHQACIQYDLRGQLYGAALIRHLEEMGKVSHISGIVLRCGSDIEANGFWARMGFDCVRIDKGGARRMRDINVWWKPLTEQLVATDAIQPSDKEQDSSAWRKSRGTGLVSKQTYRGEAMRRYREQVEQYNG